MENGGQQHCQKTHDLRGETKHDTTSDKQRRGDRGREEQTRDDGRGVGEGHPGVGEVYHLSLLCGEAWMDSSCQTSIYRAA